MTTFNTQDNIFSQNDTKIIKGIAILFMLLHHSVGKFYNLYDPGWYLENSDSWLSFVLLLLSTAGKVCVPLFTILSGYGLAMGFRQGRHDNPHGASWWRYSLSHLIQFASLYWTNLLACMVFFVNTPDKFEKK